MQRQFIEDDPQKDLKDSYTSSKISAKDTINTEWKNKGTDWGKICKSHVQPEKVCIFVKKKKKKNPPKLSQRKKQQLKMGKRLRTDPSPERMQMVTMKAQLTAGSFKEAQEKMLNITEMQIKIRTIHCLKWLQNNDTDNSKCCQRLPETLSPACYQPQGTN